MEPVLLSIGTFSRLTGISVPTLRRYDAIGLLRPVAVDEATGYRRYDRAQLGSARTIRRLRDLDVPLDIVRAILDADEAEARALLERHRERLEARSWRDQRRLHRLRQLIDRKGNVMIEDEAERRMEHADQRRLAADLFNFVWTLLEDPDRTPEQDERMVHAAHAMRYHWGEVGEPVNFARGDWQLSRVYSVLGRSDPAMRYARLCLETCRASGLEDFDVAFAYEALARASAIAGNASESARYTQLAREAGERIAEDDDREIFLADLAGLPS